MIDFSFDIVLIESFLHEAHHLNANFIRLFLTARYIQVYPDANVALPFVEIFP